MAMKTRIFCVITQGEVGGAQQFLVTLAQHLDQERFDLSVFWGNDSDPALAHRLPAWVTHGVIKHLVRPPSPLNDILAIPELRRQIRQSGPDVVLAISSKAGFVGAFAANSLRRALPRLKIIYRIGGWNFNDPLPGWKRTAFIALERLSARWKDEIVLNNTHDLKQAETLGIRPRHGLQLIYNGVDPYMPFLNRQDARQQLAERLGDKTLSGDALIVGTIANFYETKDIPTLIRAAARTTEDTRFVIIGDGPERPAVEHLINAYGLKSRVLLAGRIPDASNLLPAFDVFALTSVKEGFPWAVLEAMTAKVPVVATNVGAIPEMLTDHASGLIVPPSDPDAIALAIGELLASDRLRQELTIRAHQQVITKFSLREMLQKYETLFLK